jgi:NAD(P)-dependent dehydrogenase (short-subunit alcohol dehydrogenase family)
MTSRLSGKTAIITGASRGIGLAIAERIVAEGGRVVITARKADALEDAVADLGGPSVALGIAGNAADPEHQAEVIAAALDTFGSVDFLVNNTGINPAYGPMLDLDLDIARKVVDTNVLAAIAWTQGAVKAWMAEHGGAVVNVSSVSGVKPAPMIGIYGASKAMLISVTALLAVELAPKIRINAIAPAVVKTKFASALYEGREEEVSAVYPLKRLGEPEDIGGVVAFLLSEDAGWMTGQTIVIDGGGTLLGSIQE